MFFIKSFAESYWLSVLSGGVAAGAAQPGHQARQGGGQHQVAPRDHGKVGTSYDASQVSIDLEMSLPEV